jgi:hypothetical protein
VSEPLPEVRVGDRERREVDARLQAALADGVLTLGEYDERAGQCWAARTRSELDVLLRDLPEPHPPAPAARGEVRPRRVLAVMSEDTTDAPLAAGQGVTATAVMGTARVDLRREDLPREVHVTATAVMGEVTVHVPPGSTVHLSGFAVMGERKVRTGAPEPSGPVVHVHGTAVMGTVQVDDRLRSGGLLPAVRGAGQPHVRHRSRWRLGALVPVVVAAGVLYGGAQVVTAEDGATVFGSRTVQVGPDQREVELGVLFGSVEVVVPDGVRVRTAGSVVFGSVDCEQACSGAGPAEVVVRTTGGFGSVEIATESEAARG